VSPWWGRRSDVWGRRLVILVGLLGYALSMTLVATTLTLGRAAWIPAAAVYPLLVVSRSVFALLGSGTGPGAQAYVADRTTVAERGAAVAFLAAGMGLGETIGPGVGAALASLALAAPIYLSAALAVGGAAAIRLGLPEDGPPRPRGVEPPARLRIRDPRVVPFLVIGAALQAVRATTTITLALFLQDTLGLGAAETVRRAGLGFVVLAVAGLFAQLGLIQRLRPTSRTMLRVGVPLMLLAFLVLAAGEGYAAALVALATLGVGIGLVRPGSAAGASISVGAEEQGSVAGLLGGVTVVGNVFGPMLATGLYAYTPRAPFLMNATLMAGVMLFVLRSRRIRRLRS
jgi:MFS family permease